MALDYEIQYYRLHLVDMLGPGGANEGKFIVLKDDDLRGPFDTYEEALEAGYERFGLVSYLVKKLEQDESVLYFSRPL